MDEMTLHVDLFFFFSGYIGEVRKRDLLEGEETLIPVELQLTGCM